MDYVRVLCGLIMKEIRFSIVLVIRMGKLMLLVAEFTREVGVCESPRPVSGVIPVLYDISQELNIAVNPQIRTRDGQR
jgi:hypothetical protein